MPPQALCSFGCCRTVKYNFDPIMRRRGSQAPGRFGPANSAAGPGGGYGRRLEQSIFGPGRHRSRVWRPLTAAASDLAGTQTIGKEPERPETRVLHATSGPAACIAPERRGVTQPAAWPAYLCSAAAKAPRPLCHHHRSHARDAPPALPQSATSPGPSSGAPHAPPPNASPRPECRCKNGNDGWACGASPQGQRTASRTESIRPQQLPGARSVVRGRRPAHAERPKGRLDANG
jgi:hypothetical protein